MMFKSLKEVKVMLCGFFEEHKQVNQVFYGSDSQMNAMDDKNYPIAQIEYISSPVSSKLIQYRFNVSIQDLYNLDYPETELEIHDFSIMVIRDFIAFLNSNQISFYGGQIVVFNDSDDDITAGATIGLTIEIPLMANECNTPLN